MKTDQTTILRLLASLPIDLTQGPDEALSPTDEEEMVKNLNQIQAQQLLVAVLARLLNIARSTPMREQDAKKWLYDLMGGEPD